MTLLIAAGILSAGCAIDAPGQDESASDADDRTYRVGDPVFVPGPAPIDVDTYPSDGELCIYADEAEPRIGDPTIQHFEDGDRLVARVALPECLSSSCDVDRVARCHVFRHRNTLIVSSVLEYTRLEDQPCTLDCQQLSVTCESEPLEAGSYEVVHGDATLSLDVPSSIPACAERTPEVPEPPSDSLACVDDADCADGYCHGDGTCLPWAGIGESCGGYAPAGYSRRCDPELTCIFKSTYPDLPGSCAVVD